jgi:rhodanese-related sulfurtransferase
MEKEKGSKPKNTRLLTILISVLAGVGVILITLSLLLGYGIIGNKKAALSSTGEEESAENDVSANIVSMSVDEAYEAYNSGGDYIFLDVRSEGEYNSGHISGAVFIPVSELEGRLTELPEDKPIIAYCNGSTCGRSERAAVTLLENGFDEVYNMAGRGIDEWIEKGYPSEQTEEETAATGDIAAATIISVEEVYEIITEGEDYFILDVRNQDEYDEAHIEGVTLIPVDTLESRLNELPTNRPIIVYCKAGGRSAAAAEILVNNGFTEVYDMGGGITEWIDKGYPTVSE